MRDFIRTAVSGDCSIPRVAPAEQDSPLRALLVSGKRQSANARDDEATLTWETLSGMRALLAGSQVVDSANVLNYGEPHCGIVTRHVRSPLKCRLFSLS